MNPLVLVLLIIILAGVGYLLYTMTLDESSSAGDGSIQKSVTSKDVLVFNSSAYKNILDLAVLRDELGLPPDSDCLIKKTDDLPIELFKFENGCYVLSDAIPPSKLKIATNMIVNTILPNLAAVALMIVFEDVLTKAIVGAGKQAKSVSYLSLKTAKTVRTLGVALAKNAGRAVMNTGYKLLVFATNPVGMAFLMFDMLSLTLDLLDVGGYKAFRSNDANIILRNTIDFSWQTILKDEYPLVFPLNLAFPEEFEYINARISSVMLPAVLKKLAASEVGKGIVRKKFDSDDYTELTEEESALYDKCSQEVMEINYKVRDQIIYDNLKSLLPSSTFKYIKRHDAVSSVKNIGVTLNEEGVKWWNDNHKLDFFTFAKENASNNYVVFKDREPPMVAIYSDTYYILNKSDPGVAGDPNMIPAKFPEPVAMAFPYSMLYAKCLEPVPNKNAATVNPASLNVTYRSDGFCNYTREYCLRFDKIFESTTSGNTCRDNTASDVLGYLLGETIAKTLSRMSQVQIQSLKKIFSGQAKGEELYHAVVAPLTVPLIDSGKFTGIGLGLAIDKDPDICMQKQAGNIYREFRNPDPNCVEFHIYDKAGNIYDGQSKSGLCLDSKMHTCIPVGGRAAVKSTTYAGTGTTKIASGSIPWAILRESPQNITIAAAHKYGREKGQFTPFLNGRYETLVGDYNTPEDITKYATGGATPDQCGAGDIYVKFLNSDSSGTSFIFTVFDVNFGVHRNFNKVTMPRSANPIFVCIPKGGQVMFFLPDNTQVVALPYDKLMNVKTGSIVEIYSMTLGDGKKGIFSRMYLEDVMTPLVCTKSTCVT
jgi:hypothetical protein